MPIAFLDIAQTCAPLVAPEILAGVVSLESRFARYNIRINSEAQPANQPRSKAEAIEAASTLTAAGHDIQLGLGGIGMEELQKLKLSISDAFDPCLNLQATATLLDGYYRLAVKAGADPKRAEQVMLQSYYGRDDPSVGAMVQYDEQVRQEVKRLGNALAMLTIGDGWAESVPGEAMAAQVRVEAESVDPPVGQPASAPSWDVFNSRGRSSVLVFHNSQVEQSE